MAKDQDEAPEEPPKADKPEKAEKGHPPGLYVLFSAEMWERFCYDTMRGLLTLYLLKALGMGDVRAFAIYGAYTALVYAAPVVGGQVADKILGYRRAVILGAVMMTLGNFVICVGSEDALFLGMGIIIVGNGYFKANISSIVGKLYRDGDPRRDSGFTIFYMGINLGAMLSSLIVGYIGVEVGWGYGFGLSGVLMLGGLVQFLVGQKHLQGHAEPPSRERLRAPLVAGLSIEHLIYLGGVVTTVAVWQVLQTKINLGPLSALVGGHEVTLTEVVAVAMGVALMVWFAYFLFSGITPHERGQMIVLMTLIVVSALFWGLYEQTYGTWVAFSERVMDRRMLGFEPTTSQLTSIGAVFVIVQTPLFAWLWPRLDRRNLNPSAPAKFGLGLVFAGLAFAVLTYSTTQLDAAGLVSVWWLVLAYMVLVFGEMVLSPIGLSAVTTLSVARVVGLMMGAWFLFSAFGEIIAGRFGTWASVEPEADGSIDPAKALDVYGDVFGQLAWIGVVSGVLLLLVSPLLMRLTRGAKI